MKTRDESIFLKRIQKYENQIYQQHEHAVVEGFEYLMSNEYKQKRGAIKSRMWSLFCHQKKSQLFKLFRHMLTLFPGMISNIKKNYIMMEPYVQALEQQTELPKTPKKIVDQYPNEMIWKELCAYAYDKHRIVIGFTEVPQSLIFKEKAIPYKYALVCLQEMKKDQIEMAPKIEAGMEVASVYHSLGIATNDILCFLHDMYGIQGMANHPLGGLVDYIPLAKKAGLGGIGRHGLLIAENFGPRHRISPIYIDEKLFAVTDTNCNVFIDPFCETCGQCVKHCPQKAIYEKPKFISHYDVSRYESFDREACFKSFSATMGCSICLSVCPFSKNPTLYRKLKNKMENTE